MRSSRRPGPADPVTADEPVLVDWPRARVLRIRLNRPCRRNAVDREMLAGLHGGLDGAVVGTEARAVVLGSSTPGMFCSGADLDVSDQERAEVSEGLYDLYRRLVRLDVPVVAALSGAAVGGGAQLAVAADLRVAEPTSWLRYLGPGHGLAVGAWALPSLVGRGRALDLCLTGRRVDASEALAIGLVDRVAADAMAAAVDLAGELAALDVGAVARVKAVVASGAGPAEALELEAGGNRAWTGRIDAGRLRAR